MDILELEKDLHKRLIIFSSIDGFFLGIYGVLFNLFLKESGYSSSFVGKIAAYNLWGGAVLGSMLAILSQRFAKKPLFFIYYTLSVFFGFYRLIDFSSPNLEICSFLFGAFTGITGIMVHTSGAQTTDKQRRGKFLSVTFGIGMLVGVLSNMLGGLFGQLVGLRNALLMASLLRTMAILSIVKIKFSKVPSRQRSILTDVQKKVLLYYLLSTASVGFGAGLFVNFGNVIFYDLFGLNVALIGMILSIAQLATSIGAIFSTILAKRIGEMRLLIISYVVVPAMIVSLSFIREPITFTTVYVLRFAFMNMVTPVLNNVVFSFLPLNLLLATSGLNNFVGSSARAISANLFSVFSSLPNGYTHIFTISSLFYILNAYFMIRMYWQLSQKKSRLFNLSSIFQKSRTK
ncbi:MFS transporter [Pseudothermotoga thermarum]|uniref:Major facilitator superfamily MFS_1 n=1 Tax=Pseudothermotoga thermarum DSM 5069 TaxID=688269 RepID=F7YVW0_9THEM|nr:MFS transporter [Pseudothermotoga thermarum]AEH51782.1 major facilitator superfamily MFS_1 [Pseudothermotoga thermarum DSM 5069]